MITPKELQKKYPYMFMGPHIGISTPKGWMPIFSDLCDHIDRILGDDKQGLIWLQVKEKFGAARYYYGYGKNCSPIKIERINGEDITRLVSNPRNSRPKTSSDIAKREAIKKLIEEATIKTNHTCMCCGSPGEKVETGWIITLCDMHKRMHLGNQQYGLEGLIWFDEEEQIS